MFYSESDESSPRADQCQTPKKLKYGTRNPFKYDSSDSEPEEEEKNTKKAIKQGAASQAKASWRTTFFFTENDPRLEGKLGVFYKYLSILTI